jgi:tetratricopeptide (TPR) repeat protein
MKSKYSVKEYSHKRMNSAAGNKEALKLENARAKTLFAWADYESGKFKEAETACQSVRRSVANYAAPIYILLLLKLKQQDEKSIQKLWQQLNVLNKLNWVVEAAFLPILVRCANQLRDANYLEEALFIYDKILEIFPTVFEAQANRAGVLRSLKKLPEALNAYDAAILLDSEDMATWFNRGHVLHELDRVDEAVQSYDRALQLQPDDVDTLMCRGNVLYLRGRYDLALLSYESVLRVDPSHFQALLMSGNSLLMLNKFASAVDKYDLLLQQQPDNQGILSNRERALAGLS